MSSPASPPSPSAPTAEVPAAAPQPSIAELFLAFAAISLSGFGGVLAWARRIMVERRRWFTADQFNEAFALCAFSCDLRRHRHPALAVAARSARDRAGGHRRRVSQHRNAAMKSESGALFTLAGFFAVTSLFAVGGGNSVIPEMHRYAVDVQHWLSDRQFADSFALAQLTPGPNLIIVTLIGYHVAGIAGAVVATLAMCGPTSLLAFIVGRASQRLSGATWHGAGFVPVAIGLTAASAAVIVSVADRSWVAAAITLATAAIALFMRIHPLWAFAAA